MGAGSLALLRVPQLGTMQDCLLNMGIVRM